jgi:hypothetical protein
MKVCNHWTREVCLNLFQTLLILPARKYEVVFPANQSKQASTRPSVLVPTSARIAPAEWFHSRRYRNEAALMRHQHCFAPVQQNFSNSRRFDLELEQQCYRCYTQP